MGLQNMPSEEEVKRLQEIRKTEIQKKIAAERLVSVLHVFSTSVFVL